MVQHIGYKTRSGLRAGGAWCITVIRPSNIEEICEFESALAANRYASQHGLTVVGDPYFDASKTPTGKI